MELLCINNWLKHSGCCSKDATDELFMGVRIVDGQSVIAEFRQPFQVWIAGKKLVFRDYKGLNDNVFYLDRFSGQTLQEIKDLLYACMTGNYQNELVPSFLEYEIITGSQQTFLVVVPPEGIQVDDENYYLVFVNGLPVSVGDGDYEWELDNDGNVYFNVPITANEDEGDVKVVSIYFWYKK